MAPTDLAPRQARARPGVSHSMSTSSRPPLAASPIARIGSCAACLGRARLDDGFCRDCLDSPVRGRRWAETARRIREDPRFALLVYSRIPTDTMRALFIQLFGLPPGAPAPGAAARPRLLLVTTAIACLMVLAGCHGDPVPTPAATRATSAVADLAARAPAPPSRIEATTRASVIVAPPTSSATLGATPAAPAARPCPAAPRISAEDLATG